MSIDLTKLTPAPWTIEPSCAGKACGFCVPELPEADYRDSHFGNKADAEFITMARNAFAIQIKYGWHAEKNHDGKWDVDAVRGDLLYAGSGGCTLPLWDDPYTALVEARTWYEACMGLCNGGSSCNAPRGD